ncbi:hypothetical protein BRD06_02890, partial [Halobacteriales archaeon QS_9_67_15]
TGVSSASQPAEGTGDAPVSVTETYRLRPADPGNVSVQLAYDLSDLEGGSWSERIDHRATVVETDGLSVESGSIVWDKSTNRPTATVHLSVNATDSYGRSKVDVGEWAFFRPYTHYGDTDIDVTRGDQENLTAADGLAYLGPHEVYERSAPNQTIELVRPAAAADMRPNRTVVLDRLAAASADLDVGAVDETVTAFAVPEPIRGGGSAGDRSFWFHADGSWNGEPTYLHEYVHTRQEFDVTRERGESTLWLTEGVAAFEATQLSWRYGQTSYAFYHDRWGGEAVDLTGASGTRQAGYEYGAYVLYGLDRRIREATDGSRSFVDVFRRLNRHDGQITATVLQSLSEDVAGTSLDEYFETYVVGRNDPPVGNQPSLYPFVNTTTIAGRVGPVATDTGVVVVTSTRTTLQTRFLDGDLERLSTLVRFPHTVGVPADDGSWSAEVVERPNDYGLGYVQATVGGEIFPRDDVPDVYVFGSGQTPAELRTDTNTTLPSSASPFSVRVVDTEGDPISNASVAVDVGSDLSIRNQTTARGRFVISERAGLELSGPVRFRTKSSDWFNDLSWQTTQSEVVLDRPRRAQVVHYREDVPETAVHGTVVPTDSVAVGEPVNVTVLASADRESVGERRTVSLTVDGDLRAETEFEVTGIRDSWTMEVRFDEPGPHNVGLRSLPSQPVQVVPASDSFDVSVASLPETVQQGETMRVPVTITNTGDVFGHHNATVTVDGNTVTTARVALEAGESETVSLDVPLRESSEHTVAVDGERVGVVDVSATATSTQSTTATSTDDAETDPGETDTSASTASVTPGPTAGAGPGFGGSVTLVALVLAVGTLWTSRRF